MDLSKRNKKIAREVIEKGLQIEFAKGLNEAYEMLEKWKKHHLENREAYHLLFKIVTDFDKHISDRYDYITGSRYFITVLSLLIDSTITEEDIKDFSPDVFEALRDSKERLER